MSKTIEDLLRKELGLKDNQTEWVGKDGYRYEFARSRIIRRYQEDIGHEVCLHEELEDIKSRWVPKCNEEYWTITRSDGKLILLNFYYVDDIVDDGAISQYNYFKTKEDAQKKLDKILEILGE